MAKREQRAKPAFAWAPVQDDLKIDTNNINDDREYADITDAGPVRVRIVPCDERNQRLELMRLARKIWGPKAPIVGTMARSLAATLPRSKRHAD